MIAPTQKLVLIVEGPILLVLVMLIWVSYLRRCTVDGEAAGNGQTRTGA